MALLVDETEERSEDRAELLSEDGLEKKELGAPLVGGTKGEIGSNVYRLLAKFTGVDCFSFCSFITSSFIRPTT